MTSEKQPIDWLTDLLDHLEGLTDRRRELTDGIKSSKFHGLTGDVWSMEAELTDLEEELEEAQRELVALIEAAIQEQAERGW